MTLSCLPPRPIGIAPDFALPAGSCDAHVHILGPYAQFPLAKDRSYTAPEATVCSLIATLDALGIERGVIVNATAYHVDNAAMLSALRAYPSRLRGIAVIDETITDGQLDELDNAGVCGIRLNLFRTNGQKNYRGGAGLEVLRKVGPRIAERGWHAQIWIRVDDLPAIVEELEQFKSDIVIDHMGRFQPGQPHDRGGFQLLRALLNTQRYWVKLCGPDRLSVQGAPFLDIDPYAKTLVNDHADRLVWGSDWPHVAYFDKEPPEDVTLLDALARWAPDPEIRKRILVDNPAKLYRFEKR